MYKCHGPYNIATYVKAEHFNNVIYVCLLIWTAIHVNTCLLVWPLSYILQVLSSILTMLATNTIQTAKHQLVFCLMYIISYVSSHIIASIKHLKHCQFTFIAVGDIVPVTNMAI